MSRSMKWTKFFPGRRQCHRPGRVDFRDVAKLTKPAHHRVQKSLQVKIGDEHFAFP